MSTTSTAPHPDNAPSAAPSRESPHRFRALLKARELPVTIALVVLVVGTYLINDRFLAPQSMKDLMLNATIMVILAVGQAIVLISRNVDLSVGAILGVVAFGTGSIFNAAPDLPILLVILIGIAFGVVLGGINGAIVAAARVPALVITLGMLYAYRGILASWAGSKQYFSGNSPPAFNNLSTETIVGIPIISLIAVAVVALMAVYLGYRRSGRELYALGSDPDAAGLFGIRVGRRTLTAFALCGGLSGLAGVLYASRYNSVGALTGSGLELNVVAAAVVGGVAIFGGVGTVVGAAIGAVLLSTITSALTATRVDKFWQQAIVGVLILAAVVFDRIAAMRREKRLRVTEARDD